MTANTQGAAQAAPAAVSEIAQPTLGHNGGPPLAPAKLSRTFKLAVPITAGDGKTWDTITLTEPELGHRMKVQRRKTATGAERLIEMLSALSGVPDDAVRRIKSRDAKPMRDWIERVEYMGALIDSIVEAETADPMPLPNAMAIMEACVALGADMPAELAAAVARATQVVEAARDAVQSALTDEAREAAQAAIDAVAANPFRPAMDSVRTFALLVPVTQAGAASVATISLREPDLETGIAVEKSSGTPADATAAMLAVLSGHTIPTVSRLAQRDVARMERWLDFFSVAGETSP